MEHLRLREQHTHTESSEVYEQETADHSWKLRGLVSHKAGPGERLPRRKNITVGVLEIE